MTIANIGGVAVSSGITISLQDSTNPFGSESIVCTGITFPLGAGGSGTCVGSSVPSPWTTENFSHAPTAGDLITVTAVTADGGTAITETRAIA